MVDQLEECYPQFDGINLTFETREGILKHCSRDNARALEATEPDGLGATFWTEPIPAWRRNSAIWPTKLPTTPMTSTTACVPA